MRNYLKEANEYYPTYLKFHTKTWTRRFHYLGQLATLCWAVESIWLTAVCSLWFMPLILLVPFVIYPFAWGSHFWVEKNEPATWKMSPIITKLCDLKMFGEFLIGRLPS